MNWIVGKKICQPLEFVCGMMLNVLNVTILMVVMDLLIRLGAVNRTDWYQTAVTSYSETDVFYKEKSDVLLYTMATVSLIILVYSVYTMWIFWGQQRKRLDTQVGVFMAEGFIRRKIWCLLCADVLVDEVIALAVCTGCYRLYLMLAGKNEMWLSLYRLSGAGSLMWQGMFIAAVVYTLAAMGFHSWWIVKADKVGTVVLLKGR